MASLAQQIRDHLGALNPASAIAVEFGSEVPPEQQRAWVGAFIAQATPVGPTAVRILPDGPRVFPAVERMRAALLAVLDATDPDRYPTGCECTPCNHERVAEAIARELGIEACDG